MSLVPNNNHEMVLKHNSQLFSIIISIFEFVELDKKVIGFSMRSESVSFGVLFLTNVENPAIIFEIGLDWLC